MQICDSEDAFQASKLPLKCGFAQVTSLKTPYIGSLIPRCAWAARSSHWTLSDLGYRALAFLVFCHWRQNYWIDMISYSAHWYWQLQAISLFARLRDLLGVSCIDGCETKVDLLEIDHNLTSTFAHYDIRQFEDFFFARKHLGLRYSHSSLG